MRFLQISCLLRQFTWGQAIDAPTTRRITLRLWVVWLLVSLLALVFVGLSRVLSGLPSVVSSLPWLPVVFVVLASFLGLFMSLLVAVYMVKLQVCRLRDFGLAIWPIVALLVGPWLANWVLSFLFNVTGGTAVYAFAALPFAALSALISYYVYFAGSPLAKIPAKRAQPFKGVPVGGFEGVLLFIQQVFLWFFILFSPFTFLSEWNYF